MIMLKPIKIITFLLIFLSFTVNASIVIDGKLDEEEWKSAQNIDEFYVINPVSYTHLTLPTTPYV